MFTITRTIYNVTMKYLTSVPYGDKELRELRKYDPAMPKTVINAMEDNDYYEWARCQLDVIRARRKVAEMERELNKKNKALINVKKNIKFSD